MHLGIFAQVVVQTDTKTDVVVAGDDYSAIVLAESKIVVGQVAGVGNDKFKMLRILSEQPLSQLPCSLLGLAIVCRKQQQ